MDQRQNTTKFVLELISGADDLQSVLKDMAAATVTAVHEKDPRHNQELINSFVGEIFMSVTQLRLQEGRKTQQAKGIAKAKAHGVRFGPQPIPLPDNFDEVYDLLCSTELTQERAAQMCGMSLSTFRRRLSEYRKQQQIT